MAEKERQLPERLAIDFTICDNSVNRYYWRLLVEGIDLTGFLLNPVCCLIHDTQKIPIGKWENLRVDNGILLGTLVFDRNDPDAVKIYWKYADGFMNAVSLHIIPIEESEDPKLLLPGQKYATVVKSEMLEISVVVLPGQKYAVKLSSPDGQVYKLNLVTNSKPNMAKEDKTVEQLGQELAAARKLNADNLVKLHQQRGVVQDGELDSLKVLALNDYDTTSKMLEARTVPAAPKTDTSAAKTLAAQLVELHAERLGLNTEEKAFYQRSAELDYEGAKKALELRKGKEAINSFMNNGGDGGKKPESGREGWGYLDFFKKDPDALELMAKNEPDKFKRLEADFLKESEKLGINTSTQE